MLEQRDNITLVTGDMIPILLQMWSPVAEEPLIGMSHLSTCEHFFSLKNIFDNLHLDYTSFEQMLEKS